MKSCDPKQRLQEFDEAVKYDFETKILIAKSKIREAIRKGDTYYCSFSGGKDSMVLSHLVHQVVGNKAINMLADTRLELYQRETCINFCKTYGMNLKILPPVMTFPQVLKKCGYPMISKQIARYIALTQKHKRANDKTKEFKKILKYIHVASSGEPKISAECCEYLKERSLKSFQQKNTVTFIGLRGKESASRKINWSKTGCLYPIKKDTYISYPLAFFTDKDIEDYLSIHNIKKAFLYYLGNTRTGCFPCGFGAHLGKPNNYERLRIWHPRLHNGVMKVWGFEKVTNAMDIRNGYNLTQTFIDNYRKEKYLQCNVPEYKIEIEKLIEKAEKYEKEKLGRNAKQTAS